MNTDTIPRDLGWDEPTPAQRARAAERAAHRRYTTSETGRARHWKYNRSQKGRARRDRYEATPRARARKHLYEATVRAMMRAPGPIGVRFAVLGRPFDYGTSAQQAKRAGITEEQWLIRQAKDPDPLWFGPEGSAPVIEVTREGFPLLGATDPFSLRLAYADQVRRERAAGLLSPMTFSQM